MGLLNDPVSGQANSFGLGQIGGMGIQQLLALLKKLKMQRPANMPGTQSPIASPGAAGIGGMRSMGATQPPFAPPMSDLVNPVMNQASSFKSRGMADVPFGREDASGNLTSQFVPPGEGAQPSNDQMDSLMALLPLLKQLGIVNMGGMR